MIPWPFKTVRLGERSFSVNGPSLWNSFPNNVKNSISVDVFKSRLKTYLFGFSFTALPLVTYYMLKRSCFRYRSRLRHSIIQRVIIIIIIIMYGIVAEWLRCRAAVVRAIYIYQCRTNSLHNLPSGCLTDSLCNLPSGYRTDRLRILPSSCRTDSLRNLPSGCRTDSLRNLPPAAGRRDVYAIRPGAKNIQWN